MTEQHGNWEIFEDRVESLLARWKQFKERRANLNIDDSSIIRSCLAEINDGFTQRLMEPDSVDGPPDPIEIAGIAVSAQLKKAHIAYQAQQLKAIDPPVEELDKKEQEQAKEELKLRLEMMMNDK